MARNIPIKMIRTTRAALNAQSSASGLLIGEPYLITDENRFAVATAANAYQDFAKLSESGGAPLNTTWFFE
jgi:deoxyribose-phosphate aldolase